MAPPAAPEPTPEANATAFEDRLTGLFVQARDAVILLALHTAATYSETAARLGAVISDEDWHGGVRDSAVDDLARAISDGHIEW